MQFICSVFQQRVAKIHNDLAKGSDISSANVAASHSTFNANVVPFETFKPANTEDIVKIVRNSSSKSCVLDTLPMWLFKDNIDIMCRALKTVVNKSFSSGEFPSKLREAIVCPVLKKSTLDKNVLQNYRSVSNIRYYSKIIEKIASSQLQEHLQLHGLQKETALLRVKTDILAEMDAGRYTYSVVGPLGCLRHSRPPNFARPSFNQFQYY